MDNIGDPDYVRELGILAEAMTSAMPSSPALIALGYNNRNWQRLHVVFGG